MNAAHNLPKPARYGVADILDFYGIPISLNPYLREGGLDCCPVCSDEECYDGACAATPERPGPPWEIPAEDAAAPGPPCPEGGGKTLCGDGCQYRPEYAAADSPFRPEA